MIANNKFLDCKVYLMPDKEQIIEEIKVLIEKYENSKDKLKDDSEANIRKDYINPFFRALGWDIENSDEFDAEKYIRGGGFVDIAIKINQEPVIFIEAKKIGGIKDRKVHLLLDGEEIDADWTDEERQVLHYAGARKDIKWAILTNFEKFRLFNAKTGNTIIDIAKPSQYLSRINEILLLTKEEVINGNIDKLEDLEELPDIDTHFLKLMNIWRLSLAKEIYFNFPDLEMHKLKCYVQRILDRLVIIRYAEDKWILNNPNQLYAIIDLWKKTEYLDLSTVLNQFFRGFNDDHNSKIFEEDKFIEEIISKIDNEILYSIIKELYLQNFRKFTSDILGSTYESYLSLTISLTDNNELILKSEHKQRKQKGIYYTPPYVVKQIVNSTLGTKLNDLWIEIERLFENEEYEDAVTKFNEIYNIKILDPACGSGSFLIEAHDLFVKYHLKYSNKVDKTLEKLKKQLNDEKNAFEVFELGNYMKTPLKNFEKKILKNNIYGVDLDPTAAEIASVNLMLRAIKPDEKLPLILYENIKVGNSLITGVDDLDELKSHADEIKELIRYRELIKKSADLTEKNNLERLYKELKEQIDEELNANLYDYFPDLSEIKPFNWELEFPEVFYDENGDLKDNPGFDIVFGNPPYYNVQTLGAGSPEVEYIKNRYPHIWMDKSDILFYFIGKGIELSKNYVSYIISNTFLFAVKAKKLRNYILDNAPISTIINFERYLVFKDATITTAIVKLDKLKKDNVANTLAFPGYNYSREEICDTIKDPSKYLEIEFKKDEIFAIVGYEIDIINKKVDDDHKKLGDLVFVGKGMETGKNEVFSFDTFPSQFDSNYIKKRAINEIIKSYILNKEKGYLLYFEDITELKDLPIEIQNYLNLRGNKEKLESRAEIIRNPNAEWWKYTFALHKEYFHLNKIFCPYRAKSNRFALDETSEFLALTDTTIIFDTNSEISLKYLLAILNSKLMTVRYKSIGKPTDHGKHEFIPNQIKKIPIPEIPYQDQEPFIKIVDKILDLYKQRNDLIKLYHNLVRLSGQNTRNKTLEYYLEPNNSRDYHINLSETEILFNDDKEGITKQYSVKKHGNSLFIKVIYADDSSEDVIKMTFNNDILREFFYLAIFSSVDGVTRRYTKEGNILQRIKKDIEIPQSTNNKVQDVDNIINLMELVKKEYGGLLADYFYTPIKEVDLELINNEIKNTQAEIDKMIYDLYGLDSEERQLIEEVTS